MFDADWLLFPISGELHWTLAAIRGLKNLNFHEEDPNPKLIMLHLDSLQGANLPTHNSKSIERNLSAYMSMACYIKKKADENKESMKLTIQKFLTVKRAPADYKRKPIMIISVQQVPQQENSVDCGYYMLYFMRDLYQHIKKRGETGSGGLSSYSPPQCTGADIKVMREELKTLVDALAEEQQKRVSGEVSEKTAAAAAAASAAEEEAAAATVVRFIRWLGGWVGGRLVGWLVV